jgi:hypothetical protein
MRSPVAYLLSLLLSVGVALVMAWPVAFLVTDLFSPACLKAVFGAPELGYWPAVELLLVVAILSKAGAASITIGPD